MDIGTKGSNEYSEETSRLIDAEIKNIIDTQYRTASKIISRHREVLDKGAKLLLDKEKIEGDEIKSLMEKAEASDKGLKTNGRKK